ncbi:MAG: DUF4294 domain-containing protein [Chitinophagales bacterium]
MRNLVLILFLLATTQLFAQSEYDTIKLPQVIIGDDTLPEVILDPIEVHATKLEKVTLEEWRKRYLMLVYPYALRVARLNKKVSEDLAKCETKRERTKYLNESEKVLRANFESTLKNLTRIQGQYLILLIDRETGQTVFELLKEYRSGFKAHWWNFIGKFFDLDMKAEYDPTGKDKQIENFIVRLEEIYKIDGTQYLIDNEQFNTPVPGKKR